MSHGHFCAPHSSNSQMGVHSNTLRRAEHNICAEIPCLALLWHIQQEAKKKAAYDISYTALKGLG